MAYSDVQAILDRLTATYGQDLTISFFTTIVNRCRTIEQINNIAQDYEISLNQGDVEILLDHILTSYYTLDPDIK